jgi:hypothetical protein
MGNFRPEKWDLTAAIYNKMINDPFGTVLGVKNVKKNSKMANSELLECA